MIPFILDYLRIKRSRLFNTEYYLKSNLDVRKANINPLKHFIRHGWREGRNPSEQFNTNFYLTMYPDVENAKINPLIHYIKRGKKEGRKAYSQDIFNSTHINRMQKNIPEIPDWVIEEMKVLAKTVDPILYPSNERLAAYHYYDFPITPKPGAIYRGLLGQCHHDHYTHCFALPWLKRGGADYVALLHIEFAVSQPDSKVLVLLTEPGDSPWLSRIPEGVDVINISEYVWEISQDELLLVIVRLLIQLKIDVLHIINSRHVWEILKRYGIALRNQTKIFASLYCDDYDIDGQPVGYAREYLASCYHHITNVFSDNEALPKLLCQTYGYPPEIFRVLKSPIDILGFSDRTQPKNRQVLWAGRLDRQKRPDLLLRIVQAMPDVHFIVYGDPMLESPKKIIDELRKQSNIKMMGSFDGVESLPFHENSLFLYTSQWDGIPTIVIAAALSSIPVIASDVGGVGEVISAERGYLIKNIEDISEYVDVITKALNEKAVAEELGRKGKQYIQEQHTKEQFYNALLEIDGYVKK